MNYPGKILLESNLPDAPYGRFSVAAENPFLIFEARQGKIQITTAHGQQCFLGDPLDWLERLLAKHRAVDSRSHGNDQKSPFWGPGAFGFIAYEFGYSLQKLPCVPQDDLGLPDMWFAFYDRIACIDHHEFGDTSQLILNPRRQNRRNGLTMRKNGLGTCPQKYLINQIPRAFGPRNDKNGWEEYRRAFQQAMRHIEAGDIYQLNLCSRFSVPYADDPWPLYTRLKESHPTALSAFLDTGDYQLLSLSPELFLRKEGRRLETCPIKGTARRSPECAQDNLIRKQLQKSAKEQAEHIMIVDLERNDLGKICLPGTIAPENLMRVEGCGNVHHLVSTVSGTLQENMGVRDIIHAMFPGGSITGAPKRKAMEIIGNLEPSVRGVYTGALGWIGFSGNFMFNLPIRTLLMKDGFAHLAVGGGIVADSTAEQEYQEILDKGSVFFETLHKKSHAACLS